MSKTKGSANINHENLCFLPRKRGSLIVDKKRGRPAGTPRTQQEIANQKASIAISKENGTWRAGRFPVLKERK